MQGASHPFILHAGPLGHEPLIGRFGQQDAPGQRLELGGDGVAGSALAVGGRHDRAASVCRAQGDTLGPAVDEVGLRLFRQLTVPEVPALVSDPVFVFNLQAGTFSCVQCINGGYWRSVGIKPDRFFTGDALASDGVR